MRACLRRYERLKYQHELQHPLFESPEFPEHPSMAMWKAPAELQGCVGGRDWGKQWEPRTQPSLLREEDDQISPPLGSRLLPSM
jgi:hypothetical protein